MIDLRLGRLEDPKHTEFLTAGGTMKVFCNNFGGVFGDLSMKGKTNVSLDHTLVGLFGLMPEGSMLVTLHRPPFFVSTLSHRLEINFRSLTEPRRFFLTIKLLRREDTLAWKPEKLEGFTLWRKCHSNLE